MGIRIIGVNGGEVCRISTSIRNRQNFYKALIKGCLRTLTANGDGFSYVRSDESTELVYVGSAVQLDCGLTAEATDD